MYRTQIQLTDSQVRALKELSAAMNKSVAQLIREAVASLLRSTHRVVRDTLRRRAIEAPGKFHSGLPDLAVRHDDYLSDTYADDDLR